MSVRGRWVAYATAIAVASVLLTGCSVSDLWTAPSPDTLIKFITEARNSFVHNIVAGLTRFILYTPDILNGNEYVKQMWWFMETLAQSMMVLFFMWKSGIKRMLSGLFKVNFDPGMVVLSRIPVAAIMSGLSWQLINKVILFSNELAKAILKDGESLVVLERVVSLEGGLWFIIFDIFYLFLLLMLLLQYFRRLWMILILFITGPLVFNAWAFPSMSQYFNKWLSEILLAIFTQVVHALVLAVYAGISLGAMTDPLGNASGLGDQTWHFLLNTGIGIAALQFMLEAPTWLRQWMFESGVPRGGYFNGPVSQIRRVVPRPIQQFVPGLRQRGIPFNRRPKGR